MKSIGESLASVGLVNVFGVSYGANVAAYSNLSAAPRSCTMLTVRTFTTRVGSFAQLRMS